MFESDKIDIFGGVSYENTKIKMLGGKKHRETPKDKLKILDITKNTTLEEYKNKLTDILNGIKNSIKNTKEIIGIPAYIAVNEKQDLQGLQVCNLKPEDAINELKDNKEIILYKINLKEDSKAIFLSNSIYYDNYNKTLPIGMDITAKCLLNFDMYELKEIYKDNFRISNLIDDFQVATTKICLYEYELVEK